MLTQSTAEEDSALDLIPPPAPKSPWRVAEVQALPDFRMRVRFLDGTGGIVDISRRVHSPGAGIFACLADPLQFNQVKVVLGAVTWPCGIDLAPDAMYDAIKADGEWKL